jgi:hypothetical protein
MSKAMGSNSIMAGSPGIVFPIADLESCLYILLSPYCEGGRLCVASKLFLNP